jgi:aldose 1-epimerase
MAFNIKYKKEHILLQSEDERFLAVISPKEGGRIVQLILENQRIIDEPKTTVYEENFAGAILFPFANRIANGTYNFQGNSYLLTCNEKGRTNAIHGLVYNKPFEEVAKNATENEAKLELVYTEKERIEGFPFLYSLKLTYVLSESGLNVNVEASNTDDKAFPFTLGWHPYFYAEDLQNSYVDLESKYQVIMNEHMITVGSKNHQQPREIPLKDNFLDDCFSILDRKVSLVTPTNSIEICGEYVSKFVQLYTPPNENVVAIEPMTGISNSFNNKKSILVLRPNEVFATKWNVKFNNNNLKN